MNDILQTSAINFKKLFHKKYIIQAGHNQKKLDIIFYFTAEHFHHLIGLQKLSDQPNISKPRQKKKLFQQIIDSKISLQNIEKSVFYKDIKSRIHNFQKLSILVNNLKKKDIIIKFNKKTAKSGINADIVLYNSDIMLFLKKDLSKGENIYIPISFFLLNNKYTMRQEKYTILLFRIDHIFGDGSEIENYHTQDLSMST